MARHVKSFTYEPKIKAVRSGECTQTIRPLGSRPIRAGDTITFHGWDERPYWSKWSWRLMAIVSGVEYIEITKIGIYTISKPKPRSKMPYYHFHPWDSRKCNDLAKKDFIKPSTGLALGKLFNSMHNLPDADKKPLPFQVIKWSIYTYQISDNSVSNSDWVNYIFKENLQIRPPRDFLYYITGPAINEILIKRGIHPFDLLMRYMNFYDMNSTREGA